MEYFRKFWLVYSLYFLLSGNCLGLVGSVVEFLNYGDGFNWVGNC